VALILLSLSAKTNDQKIIIGVYHLIEIYKNSNIPSHLFTGLFKSFKMIHYVRIESGVAFFNRKEYEAVLGIMYMDKIVDKCRFNCKGN
jgi:hypothetical protein